MLRHSTNERQTLIKRTLDRLESVGKTVNAKNIPAKILYSSNIRERERTEELIGRASNHKLREKVVNMKYLN